MNLSKGTGNHKYKVKVTEPNGKHYTVQFGAKGYTDFTRGATDEQKKNYLMRHKATENWNDPHTAGFWSRWVLWNKRSVSESLKSAKNKIKGTGK